MQKPEDRLCGEECGLCNTLQLSLFTYFCLCVCMHNDGKTTFFEFVQECGQAVAALGFQLPACSDLSDLKLAHKHHDLILMVNLLKYFT